MTAASLSVLLSLSFALQGVDVDDDVTAAPPAPAAEAATPPAPPDDVAAEAEAQAEGEPAEDADDDADDDAEEGAEERSALNNYAAALGSGAACGVADAFIGALFGLSGLCLLVSSQDSDLGESIGQACSLFLGCPASLAVGIVPPLAALAGGCFGAALGEGSVWGAVGGAVPGVLVGVAGLALIVSGLALGTQTEGQGRDVLAPWPLAPGSPPTAPDSLLYTAGLGVALLAGPITVVGAGFGGLASSDDDSDQAEGTPRSVSSTGAELQLTAASAEEDDSVPW